MPVIGCGHSLGAKLLVLLGSDASMADALGPRCANALIAYNNYSAKKTIPMLENAVTLGQDSGPLGELARFGAQAGSGAAGDLGGLGEQLGVGASAGLRGAARAVESGEFADGIDALGGVGQRLGDALGLGGLGGGGSSGTAAEQLADGLGATASALDSFAKRLGTAGQRASNFADASAEGDTIALDDEFTPGPAETDRIISDRYAIGRNLLVRFADDTIDQSTPLARLFQARFTDDVTGIGGRLDFKRLDGTHVTPNAPRLPSEAEIDKLLASIGAGAVGGLADAVAGLRDVASKASNERGAASETVAEFVRRETRRAVEG